MSRELLYIWSQESLDVLVPKQRGEGFLKVPLGHHHDPVLSHLEDSVPGCREICGLDGYLCIDVGLRHTLDREKRKQIEQIAFPQLAKRFKCDAWREISRTEFFKILIP